MSNNDWTPERIAALTALWNEELPTSEIGRQLGITKNAVIGKVHRLGLPRRRSLPEQTLDVIRLDDDEKACMWPIGDPHEEGFHFCGEPTVPGKSYCAKHCVVAYIRPAPAYAGQLD